MEDRDVKKPESNNAKPAAQTPGEARREYVYGTLDQADVNISPLAQFADWLEAAEQAQLLDSSAMALATVDKNHQPSVRIVLLKGFDERGLCWFTDTHSEKGQALADYAQAELLFHWRELDRQVRIRGPVTALPVEEVDNYFYSRPLGSQLAAAASNQSKIVSDRATLDARYADLASRYASRAPRPERWGGYRLSPAQYEFWQGRPGRLHDRIQYVLSASGQWTIQRLQP